MFTYCCGCGATTRRLKRGGLWEIEEVGERAAFRKGFTESGDMAHVINMGFSQVDKGGEEHCKQEQ